MLGLSDLYRHGSPMLHWLPFCPYVCVCVFMCVFYGLDLAKSEWCLEANRGIPASESFIIDFSFSALRPWKHRACSFQMQALARTHKLSLSLFLPLSHTYIHTCINEKKKKETFTWTHAFRYLSHTHTHNYKQRQRGMYACRQTDIWTQTHSWNIVFACAPALSFWWHCYDHTGTI